MLSTIFVTSIFSRYGNNMLCVICCVLTPPTIIIMMAFPHSLFTHRQSKSVPQVKWSPASNSFLKGATMGPWPLSQLQQAWDNYDIVYGSPSGTKMSPSCSRVNAWTGQSLFSWLGQPIQVLKRVTEQNSHFFSWLGQPTQVLKRVTFSWLGHPHKCSRGSLENDIHTWFIHIFTS